MNAKGHQFSAPKKYQSLEQALDMLNELVAQGIEFPEAEYRTLFEFTHISREQLLDAYDTQERAQ